MNTSGQFTDFPKAKLATGFVILPESALMDVFYARDDTKKIVQAILFELGQDDQVLNRKNTDFETFRFKTAALEYVRDHIGRFMEWLFGCGGYSSVSVQQNASNSHYLLKGSIVTNGLEVHLLAYDTRCPRRKANNEEKPDQDQDLVRDMDDELDIEAGFTAISDIDDADNTLTVAASASASQATSASQAISASQATSASQAASYTVNWRQKSKLLDNLEVVLERPEDRARLKDAIILGADPGEVNPLVIAKLDPRKPNERHIVRITRRMHYIPYARYRQALEARKAEAGIDKAESAIPTFSRATLTQYFEYMLQSASSISFYRSHWILKKSWDLKKAQRSLIDLSIKAILGLAGGTEGRKREVEERPVVICIGLASFNSQTGLPSKHSRLEQQLVQKAKALGYLVLGAHEYFTSAKCPRPDCDNFLRQLKNRTKYCERCKTYYDRDAVGSENIAWVCQAQILDGRRPAKYKPRVEQTVETSTGQGRRKKRPGGDLDQTAGTSKIRRQL